MSAGLKRMSGAGVRAVAAGVSALLVVSVLVGCAPKPAKFTPVPQVSATPVFASDEEALAAAVEAYAKYVRVVDEIIQNGGTGVENAKEVMTGDLLRTSLRDFKEIASKNLHSVGTSTFDGIKLQHYDPDSHGEGIIVIYVCDDISNVDVVDEKGDSIVSPERRDRTLSEVTFDYSEAMGKLLVSNSEVWSPPEC